MINTPEHKKVYKVQSGVTEYPIGFPYHFNPDGTPQLEVVIGVTYLTLNHNCKLSEDKTTLILIPTEEEAEKLTGPDDYSWMDKWHDAPMVISRAIPFVQESDYQLGRISSEQIERDFDASVMRDQMLADKIGEHTVDVQAEIDGLNSRIDLVQEEHLLDMAAIDEVMATKATKTDVDEALATKADKADVDRVLATKADKADVEAELTEVKTTLSTKATKTELENAKTTLNVGIQGNAQAIQKTRDDYQAADQGIRADMNSKDSELETILNDHAERLNTLRTDHDDLGDDVSDIQSKIPQSASGSNPLITKQQLLDEEMDIREDLNSGLSELQTQITAQATAIAGKQKQLQPGDNVFINRVYPDYDIISVPNMVSSLNGLSGALNLQAGSGIEIDGLTISATGGGSGGASYTAGDGIDITDNTISTDISVIRNTSTAQHALGLSQIRNNTANAEGSLTVGNYAYAIYGANYSIAIGTFVQTGAPYAIQIGGSDASNHDANTLKVGNENGNFEMMSADGTIPTDRYAATPAGAGTYVPKLTIAEDGTATREWGAESGGGGTSLPDQTDNAGKGLLTDGANLFWGSVIVNNTTVTDKNKIVIGSGATDNGTASNTIVIGTGAGKASGLGNNALIIGSQAGNALGYNGIAIGAGADGSLLKRGTIAIGTGAVASGHGAIQLGGKGSTSTDGYTNSEANTLKVGNANGNFTMMDADGNVPLERLTYVTAQIGDISTALTAILGE